MYYLIFEKSSRWFEKQLNKKMFLQKYNFVKIRRYYTGNVQRLRKILQKYY